MTLLALTFAFLALFDATSDALALAPMGELLFRSFSGILSAVTVLIYWLTRKPLRFADNQPPVRQKSEEEIEALIEKGSGSTARREAFGLLVVEVKGRSSHIKERYSIPAGGRSSRVVSREFVIPESVLELVREVEASIPFPIMTARKGHLVDDLRVTLEDGRELTPTPYEEVLVLQINVLETLFEITFGDRDSRSRKTVEFEGKRLSLKSLETNCVRQVARYGDYSRVKEDTNYVPLEKLLIQLEAFRGEGPSDANWSELSHFVGTYCDAYPVTVEIQPGDLRGRFTVNYSHAASVETVSEGLRDSVRFLLGLPPYKFRLPLSLMYFADSHHVGLEGDAGSYLFAQGLRRGKKRERVTAKEACSLETTSGTPYIRLRHTGATSFAHTYARGFDKVVDRPDLVVQSRFNERPPGATGTACLLSWVLFAFLAPLAWLMGLPREDPSLNTDIPALLLVLPGVSAALLGQEFGSASGRSSSLSARVGLAATLFFACSGVVLYLAQTQGRLVGSGAVVGVFNAFELPIKDPSWLILCGSVLLVSIWLSFKLVLSFVNYRYALNASGEHRRPEW